MKICFQMDGERSRDRMKRKESQSDTPFMPQPKEKKFKANTRILSLV